MTDLKLTQAILKKNLCYDPVTGDFTWRIQKTNSVKVGDIAGSVTCRGYRNIKVNNKIYKAHRLAWLYVYGYFPEHGIDHINRCVADNRISNLREASQSCNLRNSALSKTNRTGVKGVSWDKAQSDWFVQIGRRNKTNYVGRFKFFTDAVIARYEAEQQLNWVTCEKISPAHAYLKKMGVLDDISNKPST